jgi:hypothetical protein
MPENEDYEDWDEESEEWSPEWYPLPEDQDKLVEKKWIPYKGPLGGTGWRSTENPRNIRYQEEMPHEKEEHVQPLSLSPALSTDLRAAEQQNVPTEEAADRVSQKWLSESPKGSKVHVKKVVYGTGHHSTYNLKLYYPPIKSEEDMMNQAYHRLYTDWKSPEFGASEASRFTQEMFMSASGFTDEEGRALLSIEERWTGSGGVNSMRGALASIDAPQGDSSRVIHSDEARSAIVKWKSVYWKYLKRILSQGIESLKKKDVNSRNWPPHRTLKNISDAIDEDGNIRLYRGLKIEKEQWEQLQRSKNVRLILNNLDSWSANVNVATSFSGGLKKGKIPIVLEYRSIPEEIANGWPFVGYVNEAEFILNLSQDNQYEVSNIESQGEGVSQRYVVSLRRQLPEKQDILTLDLTGENDWALMRRKQKKVKETEEVVVATYGSTPWSEDKPPRPDRPKKKEKVIISEYVKKYRWEGPKKGPRGGTYMISPGGKKVYDKSKWPAADRAAAEQAAKPKPKLKPMPIEGWDFFEQVEGSAFTIGAVSGEVIKVPTNFMIYHRVTPDGSDLTLKIDMGVNPGLAKEMTDMISSVYEHLPSMLLKHNKVINILRDIQSPGMPARFGTFAQNLGKYGQRYSEIELNARLFRQVDSIEGRYAKWDEILAHEMAHGMVRGMTGHQNPTFMPHIDSMMDYIEAFTDDAVANMKDVKTEEGEDLIDQPNALRRELAFISRYAFNSANVYEWEKSTLANIPGDSYSIDSLVEDIAETIGYMATNVEKFGGLDEFVKRYPNRVAWYEKWVLGGRLWQGPRQ